MNLENIDDQFDDGYSETTRNRLASLDRFHDDARRVIEFNELDHIDPHAVISMGVNIPLRLNELCAYMLWSLMTLIVLGFGGSVNGTGVCSDSVSCWRMPCDHGTGVFNRHCEGGKSGRGGAGVFNSAHMNNESGLCWEVLCDQRTGVFNRHFEEGRSGRGSGVVNSAQLNNESGHGSGVFNNDFTEAPAAGMNMLQGTTFECIMSPRERGLSGINRGGGTPVIELIDRIESNASAVGSANAECDVEENSANEMVYSERSLNSSRTIQVDFPAISCRTLKESHLEK